MIYYLTSGVFCYAKRSTKQTIYAKTKLELGEDYGMRGASALGKEWYEHSEGFCDALKGKTRTEIAEIGRASCRERV